MKTKLPWILTIILAITLVAVLVARPNSKGTPSSTASAASQKKVLYWVDPMHPAYRSDKPGKAPDCGMQLVPVYDDAAPSGPPSNVSGYANVKLTPERQQLIGVQTGVVETRDVGRSVRTVGRIAVDETRLYKVSTKFDD